jgi:lipoprotein-releasing system permease protein
MYLGIIISVIALCTTFIIFEGYEKTLKKTILGVNSHVYFFNPGLRDLSADDFQAISSFLDAQPEVRTYSGIISGQAIITHGERSKGSFFKSIDWQNENQSSIYREAINVGEWRLFEENDVVIGHYLAKSLNVGVGDEISVMSTTSASMGLAGISYRSKRMKIVGIFYSGMYEYDSRYLFLNTETAKHFEATGSDFTMVEVQLHERYINDASTLAVAWGRNFNYKYEIVSWIFYNGTLFSLLALEKWVLTIIISFLVMVASFNVITTTLATIEEKRKEIGLLKTIGLSSKKIAALFLAQINLMSFVCISLGILCGIGLGYLISYQTMIMLRGEVYLLDKIYIHVDFVKMCLIFAIASFIINLAAIVPLRQIVRMSEIQILRSKK